METTTIPTKITDQQKKISSKKSIKDLEKLAVEKKIVTPTRFSTFEKLLDTTVFKVILSVILFSLLFAVAFVISYLSSAKKAPEPLSNSDIIPTAEINLPTSIPTITAPNGTVTSPKLSPTPSFGISQSVSCATTGCNDELCVESSQKDKITSICVFKDVFVCYHSAKCEKQQDGKCGWTQTTELKACLSKYE